MDKTKSSNKLISKFEIFQNESEQLCLIDPMILTSIIIVICLILYVFEYKFIKYNKK